MEVGGGGVGLCSKPYFLLRIVFIFNNWPQDQQARSSRLLWLYVVFSTMAQARKNNCFF